MRLWQVYALRYAVHDRLGHENFVRSNDLHDAPMPMDYFVWVLRSNDETIVVDTGFDEVQAAKRGRKLLRTVGQALADFGFRRGGSAHRGYHPFPL